MIFSRSIQYAVYFNMWVFFFDDAFEKVAGVHDNMMKYLTCLLYTSPSPRDKRQSRMPSSA